MKKMFLFMIFLLLITMIVVVSLKSKVNKAQSNLIQNTVSIDKNSKEYKTNQTLDILRGYEGRKQGNYARALVEKIRELNEENDIKISKITFQQGENTIEVVYDTDSYEQEMKNVILEIDVDREYEVKIKNENEIIEIFINE